MGDKSNYSNTQNSDAKSPLYLHPSDCPGQVHVTEKLHDGNYIEWADEMSNFLLAKNKMGFVDGSVHTPEEGGADYESWRHCNAMIRGWLSATMDKEIRSSVRYAKTAKQIWTDLAERFGTANAPRAYELRRDLAQTHQNNMKVSTYYTKLKGIWEEIQSVSPALKCTCKTAKEYVENREKEQLYEFLMGLDETFNTVKT